MLYELNETRCIWQRLQEEKRPIVLYGMGDGADKILAACRDFGIQVQGVFASDGFVRGHDYQGFPVRTLGETEQALGSELVVLLAFATQRPDVLQLVDSVAARHTLLAPDLPVCGGGLFTMDYLLDHRQAAQNTWNLLADDVSRQIYLDLLHYKISGDVRYLKRCETPKSEAFDSLLRLGTAEAYLDAGAYTGDTVEEFLQVTGGTYRRITALEPDKRNFKKLIKTTGRLELGDGVRCLQVGAWSGTDTLLFAHKSGRQAALGGQGVPTPVDSIDHILQGEAVTYIKYDVEGAEEQALLGSRATIARHTPKLLVSAYHRNDDLFRLPALIHSLHPGYRIHLRHHPYIPAWDTNLYALPGK